MRRGTEKKRGNGFAAFTFASLHTSVRLSVAALDALRCRCFTKQWNDLTTQIETSANREKPSGTRTDGSKKEGARDKRTATKSVAFFVDYIHAASATSFQDRQCLFLQLARDAMEGPFLAATLRRLRRRTQTHRRRLSFVSPSRFPLPPSPCLVFSPCFLLFELCFESRS
jgi:hypothetical protein